MDAKFRDDSLDLIRATLDAVATPVVLYDPDGQILHFNRAAEQASGHPARDVCGRVVTDVVPALPGVELRPTAEHEWVGHDGSRRRVAWTMGRLRGTDGAVRCTLGTGVDVTARTSATEALRESEQLHRITLDNISDAVFITDDAGVFTFICPNVHVIFGYSFAEVRALGCIGSLLGPDFFDPDELCRRGELQNIEREIADRSGRRHALLVTVKRVAIKGGTVLYSCRDVTAHKQAEETAREYQAELARATRLSAMGEMASGLAHELNQPLAAIANFAHASTRNIQAGRAAPAELLSNLEQIAAQAERAAEIIRRMREFVRKGKPRRTPIAVAELVRGAVALTASTLRKHAVALHLELADTLPSVQVDPVGIQQVILNLIRNACEALAEANAARRVVTIGASPAAAAPAIEIGVADTGPGLPPSLQERVFEPFTTTKPDGMGLGLSISRSIVESHGGRLWATANADGGVTFRFTLPCCPDSARPPD